MAGVRGHKCYLPRAGTLPHAVLEVQPDLKRATPKRTQGDVEFSGHAFVMLNLVMSVIQVVMQDELSFRPR